MRRAIESSQERNSFLPPKSANMMIRFLDLIRVADENKSKSSPMVLNKYCVSTDGVMTGNRMIILASVVLIFITTLFPFNFTLRASVLGWNALALTPGIEGKREILENILLFFPLGLAITADFCSRRLQIHRILLLVLVICFTTSYFCEVLQFFLPSRFPSWRDVASNTMGGILGSLCVFVWTQKVSRSFCLTK